jgi:hypothetical protein
MRGTHHGHVCRIRNLDVVGVAAAPAHEAQVLDARHRGPDAEA